MSQDTFWNGEPATARRVVVVVGHTDAPLSWAREFEGTKRFAVEVAGGNYPDSPTPFYLDDERGSGWHKVTTGHGSPAYGHRNVPVERVVRELAPDEPCNCGEAVPS